MFKKTSLKVKQILLYLLVGLVPLAAVAVLSFYMASQNIETEVLKGNDMVADLVDARVEDYFLEGVHITRVLANTRDVYQSLSILQGAEHQGQVIETSGDTNDPMWLARTSILDSLLPIARDELNYAFIFLTDPRGVVVYDSQHQLEGVDLSQRGYIQTSLEGRVNWSDLFYSDVVDNYCIVVSSPVYSGGGSGQIVGTYNNILYTDDLEAIIHEGLQTLGQSADSYLINADGLLLTDTMLGEYREGSAMNVTIGTEAVERLSGPISAGNFDFHWQGVYDDYLGHPVLGAVQVVTLGEQPVGLVVEIDYAEAFAGVYTLRNIMLAIAGAAAVIVALVAFLSAMGIVRPVAQVSNLTRLIAAGDFTRRAEVKSRDEVGQMAFHLNDALDSLSDTLRRVKSASDYVYTASSEISAGNQDLSQRTEEQASSLEEVASTIEQMSTSLQSSSSSASEADNLSRGTMESVHQGEKVIREMQEAMTEITRGSQEISEIISAVNDIAFQTNLLALNAAVEAARAGEQGRGFAVVAAEVRNLAGRSAESAKEIEKLIKDSITRVERGNNLMGETEKVLRDIVENTQKTSDVVGEIAASLSEQSTASAEIRNAIEELNQVTQQNASLVEEIASASENMNSEATELSDAVATFTLAGSGESDRDTRRKKAEKSKTTGFGGTHGVTRAKVERSTPSAYTAVDDFELSEADFERF